MSGDVQLELWLHEYKVEALSSVLAEQGTTVEQRMQDALTELYVELVPPEMRQEISARIKADLAAQQEEIEAARKYAAFCIKENETTEYFQLDFKKDLLDVGIFLRRYLEDGHGPAAAALQSAFGRLKPVTTEQYSQLTALRIESPNKVTGVFDLDFDKRQVSSADAADGWKTYTMKDIKSAVYHAYRKGYLRPDQYETRFLDKLDGKELTSAGHLSALDISFAEEISEINGLLNFYMATYFNVDAVFGTHVCTGENDDTLNVYANYDMATGQVCDELEVDLHWADGREEAVTYRLNAVEKATLLRKMDEYCQQQTGQTLAEYSAQRMAEDMTAPSGPMM